MSNKSPSVFDPGCTHTENGLQFRESDIVLKYGLALKDILRARNVEVFMTRDDDTDHAPVGKRASNAKNAGCGVLVSIHVNDIEDESANGLEVLYGSNGNKKLAQSMQNALIAATKLRDRGIKLRTDLAVLRFQGPAVLIELGFVANDKDRDTFTNPQIREKICTRLLMLCSTIRQGEAGRSLTPGSALDIPAPRPALSSFPSPRCAGRGCRGRSPRRVRGTSIVHHGPSPGSR